MNWVINPSCTTLQYGDSLFTPHSIENIGYHDFMKIIDSVSSPEIRPQGSE